jgi:2-succinyl-5-enolpyruvyl-6-hydroxy-3-cyclohexene-1-carboxylate synthase
MYTDDKNAQIVLALLKAYGIRKIVISPGMTNVPVAMSVEADPFFEAYSVVDERSAAYFAGGLAFESGEPVVISCTGATASRNYLPGLTEAFYRNLPVIALTSQHGSLDYEDFIPQVTNRTVSQEDVKRLSVFLPVVKDRKDAARCELLVNKALTACVIKGRGPVHINLLVDGYSFTTAALPQVRRIEYYGAEDMLNTNFAERLAGRNIGVFIGAHRKFSEAEAAALNRFVDAWDAVVFYDHTSGYRGKNKALTSVAADLKHITALPDLMIDSGSISGDYSSPYLFGKAEIWRVSEDGRFHQRHGALRALFECREDFFFNTLAAQSPAASSHAYYAAVTRETGAVAVPDLPLSNTLIASTLSSRLPKGCSLHLGILNSLRNMDFFELDDSIDASCNVGGFGIDGAVSTLAGQSCADRDRLYFAVIGDLAFFYDMNALGLRHIQNNLRLLLVNNGRGVEFRVNPVIESQFRERLDEFTAAGGHYGSAKAWAESMRFTYLSAATKEAFLALAGDFCSPDKNRFDRPVLFEVFTTVKDEQDGLKMLREANQTNAERMKAGAKSLLKSVLPTGAIEALRELRKKG